MAKTIRALRNHIRFAKDVVPFYREILKEIDPEDITDFDQFSKLPLINRERLRQTNALMGVDTEAINETVVSTCPGEKDVIIVFTGNDLERIGFGEALSFHSMGLGKKDRVPIMLPFDRLHLSGMAYYRGLTMLEANVARLGFLLGETTIRYLNLLQPTALIGMPTFLKKMGIECASKAPSSINALKKIVCTGESIRNNDMELNALGKRLEEIWDAAVYATHTVSEVSVSYCECDEQYGGHAHPELVYTEIVDQNGNPVPDGTPGELVVTPLGVEGMPIMRYKTGDCTFIVPGTCACGRNSVRIGPILGRNSQLIRTQNGVIYPQTVIGALDEVEEVEDYVVILERETETTDRATIHAVAAPAHVEKIANRLRSIVGIYFPILISNTRTIQSLRGNGQITTRILDWRK